MTYYDKINNELTNFLVIPNVSNIAFSYLFTYGNKYIINLNKKQKINKKFPKEFYKTSFYDQFVLCDSKIKKNENDGFICKIDNKNEFNYESTHKDYKNDLSVNNDIDEFMKYNESNINEWCVFLAYAIKYYWLININKKSKLYGNILRVELGYTDNYCEIVCKNIIQFEHIFYQCLELVQIKKKYNKKKRKCDVIDCKEREYAFENLCNHMQNMSKKLNFLI